MGYSDEESKELEKASHINSVDVKPNVANCVFQCPECKSYDVYMKEKDNNVKLYCGSCGTFIKCLDENEIELARYQIYCCDKELEELIDSLPD